MIITETQIYSLAMRDLIHYDLIDPFLIYN